MASDKFPLFSSSSFNTLDDDDEALLLYHWFCELAIWTSSGNWVVHEAVKFVPLDGPGFPMLSSQSGSLGFWISRFPDSKPPISGLKMPKIWEF